MISAWLVPMLARFPAIPAMFVTMFGMISNNFSDLGGNPRALGPSIKELCNLKGEETKIAFVR